MRTLLFLALMTAPSPMLGAEDDFEALLQKGRNAWATRNIPLAADYYRQACSEDRLKAYGPARVASCEHHVATISFERGEYPDAERRYLHALALWKSTGNDHLSLQPTTLLSLGELYRRVHKPNEAEAAFLQADAIARQIETSSPDLPPQVLNRLGTLYQETDRLEPARAAFTEALQRLSKLDKPAREEQAMAWNGLGMVDLQLGLSSRAEASLRKAVSLASSSLGEDSIETATYQTNLALALILQRQFDSAGTLLRRARMIVETHDGSDTHMALILAEMCAVASGQNKFALAEDYGEKAVTVLSREKDALPVATALARVNLADVYLREHKLEDAERLLPGAVATERLVAPDTRLLADGIRRLADLRLFQHSYGEARQLYLEAIDLYERKLGRNNPVLAPVLRGYAEALKRDGGSKQEIRISEARAKAVLAFAPGN